MDISLFVLVGMIVVAIIIVLWRGRWQLLISGLKQSGKTFRSMWPRLVLGFTLGGLIQVLIPSSVIAEWLGPTSGLKGILIGSYAGIIVVGGPFVTMPILASIYLAGAGPGPVIALLASINMLSFSALITMSLPFLGAKIALTRWVICLFFSPLVGLFGSAVYQLISIGE